MPQAAVNHSPTPSTVKIAASLNGEQKNVLAACDRWCSEKRTLSLPIPNSDCRVLATHNLSRIQPIMDSRKTFQDWGYVCKTLVRIRSSFRNGFSKKTT